MLIIPEEDKYYSIKAKNRSEIKIKGSRGTMKTIVIWLSGQVSIE